MPISPQMNKAFLEGKEFRDDQIDKCRKALRNADLPEELTKVLSGAKEVLPRWFTSSLDEKNTTKG